MKFFGLPRLATKRDLLTTDSFVLLSNHALQRYVLSLCLQGIMLQV